MVFKQCFCDPFKLTYMSAIFTAVEAVAFGTLNLVLILMNRCVISPSDHQPGASFDFFWMWYFYDPQTCEDRGVTLPGWVLNNSTWIFPITNRPTQTSVDANLNYQITYLVLHALWFITAFVLIYGNARKLWGYYLPWLVISLTIIIMDVTVSAFFISDIVYVTGWGYRSAMFWVMAMYFRIFIIWFVNINKFASASNAFRKSYHKRTKQARVMRAQEQRLNHMAKQLAAAEKAAKQGQAPV